jgi:hypothetical protein
MNQSKNSTQQRTSNPEQYVLYLKSGLWVKKPNPPTPEMIARAQPYRADTLQEMEAIIKHPSHVIHG